MKIGIIGKPNTGKSTLFKALTEKEVEIANYPFTTINPNLGICFVSKPCVCHEFNVECQPQNSKCINGQRLIPINILDVAGLVPGASEGKGMGNQFLSNISEASCLIQVLDTSGTTNEKGEITENYSPEKEINFIEEEINNWFYSIIFKNWINDAKRIQMQKLKVEDYLFEKFSGLGISRENIINSINKLNLQKSPEKWAELDLINFSKSLREKSKPIIYACNKMDLPNSENNFYEVIKQFPDKLFIPIAGDYELALKNASKNKLINYFSGNSNFEIIGKLSEIQKLALEKIQNYLKKYNSTGVQKLINKCVFELLNLIVVYPVEDETHLKSGKGNTLPDAILMKKGSTVLELAFKIHTDIGKNFIKAVNARTKQIIGKDYQLKDNDIIKIVEDA